MSGGFAVYDAGQVTVNVVGIPIDAIGGYADGEFLRIEWDDDDFKVKKGTDGHVTRSKTYNKLAKVTLRLAQGSKANAALATLSKLDRTSDNGAGVGPFLVQDRQGLSLHAGSKCWIHKRPDPSYDSEAKEREWIIMVADLESFDGGN